MTTEVPQNVLQALNECDLSLFAGRLRYARLCAGEKRAAVAAAAGVSRPTAQDWEENQIKQIGSERAFKIATFLKCSVEWLVTGVGDPPAIQTKALTTTPEKQKSILQKPHSANPVDIGTVETIFSVSQVERRSDLINVLRWLIAATPETFELSVLAVHRIVTSKDTKKMKKIFEDLE